MVNRIKSRHYHSRINRNNRINKIRSIQQKIYYICIFLGIISKVYILRDRGQNYLIFFSCILGGRGGLKENKRSRESLCIKQRDSFLKNKFTMLSDSAEGKNLSGWF